MTCPMKSEIVKEELPPVRKAADTMKDMYVVKLLQQTSIR